MELIPTPKTIARINSISIENEDSCCDIYVRINGKLYDGDLVDAEFAKDLERQVIQLTEFVKEYVDAWENGMAGDSGLLRKAKIFLEE